MLFLAAASPLYALTVPEKPEARVNDYAALLSPAARAEIENTLADFEKATSNQVVVAIFPSLEGGSLEDFSIRLADRWKIGDRKKDNGVILLVFKEDRQVRIEVGYGLEGALPDAVAHQIIRNEVVPAFREGRFDDGVKNAVTGIIRATRGEYAADERDPALGFPAGILAGLAAVFALAAARRLLFSPLGQTLSTRGGGHFGGFGGGGFSGGGFGGGFGGGGGGGFGGGGAGGRW